MDQELKAGKAVINLKRPLSEIAKEFQMHFCRLAIQIGLREARRLEDMFLSDIADQMDRGKGVVEIDLPTLE